MKLGAFSISLAVKDIAASRAFYEKLGFTVFGGNQDQRWLIMKNDTTIIGLFQGMSTPAGTATPKHWRVSPIFATSKST
jgi:catechol 2,3-dioxygenase-like lactoylglutathione lyase family enzyme